MLADLVGKVLRLLRVIARKMTDKMPCECHCFNNATCLAPVWAPFIFRDSRPCLCRRFLYNRALPLTRAEPENH